MSLSLVPIPVTEHIAKSSRHSSYHVACGPETGPLIVFVDGWPDLGMAGAIICALSPPSASVASPRTFAATAGPHL